VIEVTKEDPVLKEVAAPFSLGLWGLLEEARLQ
jgi:hypothetical protein